MKDYLILVPRYLSAHKKKSLLTIFSIAIAVALVTGVFSMLDVFLKFERLQVIHDYGNFHLAVKDPADQEIAAIKNRIDVKNSGQWKALQDGSIQGKPCKLGALDENFAENLNIEVIQGKYPTKQNEIMLEKWATESIFLDLNIGDSVTISLADNGKKEFILSGVYNDLGNMKAAGIPGVFVSTAGAEELPVETNLYLVEFKNRVNINEAVEDIKKTLKITDERVELNNHLLAVIGQSEHKAATGLYIIGGILFLLVLVAGVVMIYNTFNISVMERVRQFGLLRCIGASQLQIKKLVKREGLIITLRAIPLGILAGMLITFVCSAILKFYNSTIFADIPLFSISVIGIGAGIIIGFLTVYMASLLPAKKAARVSPVNAVAGSNELKTTKRKKRGFLTKLIRVDIALGVNNAFLKKKTFILMSCSIAISIIMFLGFNVLVDVIHSSLKTTKPYTPDISLVAEQGINDRLYAELSEVDGIKRVYGRMFSYVDATFAAARLTDTYKESMGGIRVKNDGLFIPPEKSWLISYDQQQLHWAKRDLLAGELSEDKLNENFGVIAVVRNLRNNIATDTANLQVGDTVFFDTPNGVKELTVLGILRSVPFSSKELTLGTFITTEEVYTRLTGETLFKAVDIQLKSKNNEQAVDRIKGMVSNTISFRDQRQQNTEMNQTFLTMAVFIYGFVAVIALISILNIINTMNTSVASKIRYLGIMRAIGMSGSQLSRMILVEATTYTLTGCISGCILGIILQKILIANYLDSFHIVWQFPTLQIILIFIITLMATALSIISPLKRIKSQEISTVVNSI